MIEFPGRLLRMPASVRPLKFDITTEDGPSARFSVPYDGQTHHVHDRSRPWPASAGCGPQTPNSRCEDSTLTILTLLMQLLNLNKSQSELPATNAVQVVQ